MTWFRLAYLMYLLPLPFLWERIHAGTIAYLMGLGVVTVVFLADLIRELVPDASGRRTSRSRMSPRTLTERSRGGEGTSEPHEPLTDEPADADDTSDFDGDVSALVEAIADRVIAGIEESIETGVPARVVIGSAVYMIDVRARSRGLRDPAMRN